MYLPRRLRRSSTLSCLAGLATIVVCLTTPVSAQYTLPLPPGDLAYRDLDRLEELELFESAIMGAAPVLVSRGRPARAGGSGEREGHARPARASAGRGDSHAARAALRAGIGARPYAGVEDVTIGAVSTDAWRRALLGSFGQGAEATIRPAGETAFGRAGTCRLVAGARGRPVDGAGVGLAFHARERLEVGAPRDDSISRRRVELLVATMRLRVRNLAVTVGREPLWWAQGEVTDSFSPGRRPRCI
jgi:hypothetical protein